MSGLLLSVMRPSSAQSTSYITDDEICSTVRYFIEQETTPYELGFEGSVLQPDTLTTERLDAGLYSRFHVINVQRESGQQATELIIDLEMTAASVTASENTPLEFALFRGMEQISGDYQPVTRDTPYVLRIERDDVYTLVVRRTHPRTLDTALTYTLTASFPGGEIPLLASIRDETANARLIPDPALSEGTASITVPSAEIHAHVGAVSGVATLGGRAAQTFFNGGNLLVGGWVNRIDLLGGDLGLRGEVNGNERIFYLEDYGYRANIRDEQLNDFLDANGTAITIGWSDLKGVWVMRDCAGFKLTDGRSFTVPLIDESREVSFNGTLDNFTISVETLNASRTPAEYSISMNWHGVAPDSEMQLRNGSLAARLIGDREIAVQGQRINFFRRTSAGSSVEFDTPLDITLLDEDISLTLDWVNIESFRLADNVMRIIYDDLRGVTERPAENLLRFEALEAVIQIEYDETNNQAGEVRLLLPASESYIEIVTPAGLPFFDSLALPADEGFMPRALNNFGGECYPVNTFLEEANCPQNGYPNPANGNLWYSVEDIRAHGGLVDLVLQRSYNSALVNQSGAFGIGWTSPFELDYDVAYDPVTASRLIMPEDAGKVALNLTWAPRALVTFTTPTGSQHVFSNPDGNVNNLRAITMPGWTLTRENLRDNWTLTQLDGFTYTFDRGGRLLSYGYPDNGRVIDVIFARDALNGLAESGTAVITDDPDLRQLELYYDDNARVVRSVMRDVLHEKTLSMPVNECLTENGCFETLYDYDSSGRLTDVTYADSRTASYDYDEGGRMVSHDDPRAPITANMFYRYNSFNEVEAITYRDGGSTPSWRLVERVDITTNSRIVAVTDEFQNRRVYTYARVANTNIRQAGNGYTLQSVSSPFEELITTPDASPQAYTWTNGLLTQINPRLTRDQIGRNSISFQYTMDGQIRQINGGRLGVEITYDESGRPLSASFPDETSITYTYNEAGQLIRLQNRYGAVENIQWDETGQAEIRTRENDGITTSIQFNSIGLPTTIAENGYTVEYGWDGLGRLIRVDDPLTGETTLTYDTLHEDAAAAAEIRITDAVGAVEVVRLDVHANIIEQRVESNGELLRHLERTFDIFKRLKSETVWADEETPLVTTFSYTPQQVLESREGDTEQPVINGYVLTVTDPYGRTTRYTYDAFDRLRQIDDPLQRITRYEYLYSGTSTNGLRVVENQLLGSRLLSTTTYLFNLQWQLREVQKREVDMDSDSNNDFVMRWSFVDQGTPVTLRFLNALNSGISGLTWYDYVNGLATRVTIKPTNLPIQSITEQPTLDLTENYDFLGRPVRTVDASGNVQHTIYCTTPDGGQRILISVPNPPSEFTCQSETTLIQTVYVFDARERLVGVRDSYGIRTFAYSRDEASQEWVVDATFEGDYEWQLRYNAAGDLTQWTDESGFVHDYEHDMAGRLLSVTVPDEPEASYTFEYNALGQIIRQVDGLGRGTFYEYDSRGLMIVRQDALTADATTFSYGQFGNMTSTTSPLGNTITFLYNDGSDPLRLTGVIDPSGIEQRLVWDDANSRLTYSDVRNNIINYYFDSFGQLWRVDDGSANRLAPQEFIYDAEGRLRRWVTIAGQNRGTGQNITITSPEYGVLAISEANQSDWTWNLRFNADGQFTEVTPPNGTPLDLTYDGLARLQSAETGPYTWSLQHEAGEPQMTLNDQLLRYDSLFRLLSVEEDGEPLVTYDYGVQRRNEVTVTVTNDTTRKYTFSPGDSSSRARSVTLGTTGHSLSYIYNAEGQVEEIRREVCYAENLSTCEAGSSETQRTSVRIVYDAQGRPFRIIDEEQNIETFSYDDVGNLVTYQSANGRTYTYQYDNLNRLTSAIGSTGIKILLSYNALDQVNGICRTRADAPNDYNACVSSNGLVETFTYDSLGRLTQHRYPNSASPDGFTTLVHRYENGVFSQWGPLETGETSQDKVLFSYSNDALAMLEQVLLEDSSGDTSEYRFIYGEDLMLSSVNGTGGVSYTYDEYNRVTGLDIGESLLNIDYAPDRGGYAVIDDEGAGLGYSLDERGLLSALRYATSFNDSENSDALLAIQYRLNPRDLDVLTMLLRAADEIHSLDLQVNLLGETNNLVLNYGNTRLLVDYVLNSNGEINRQRLDGSPATFFIDDTEGYINVIGYNDNDRVSTMRITTKNDSTLLYVLNFTYNETGQRETETRRFADDTQITIRYHYGNANQLTRRVVSITWGDVIPSPALNGLPIVGLLAMLWFAFRRRWRVALVLVVMSIAGVTLVPHAYAQRTQDIYTYFYSYDAHGNLARVEYLNSDLQSIPQDVEPLVCWTFDYDAANRLTGAENTDRTFVYEYDAYNRLVRANNLSLAYAGEQPIIVYTPADVTSFYGRLALRPLLFIGEAGNVNWLLPDGRDRLLADGRNTGEDPLLIFDPLGRAVTLDIPTRETLDLCQISRTENDLFDLPYPQPANDGMLWHPQANLYFGRDGRAYMPEIGRFLQRDIGGPDIFGSVYDLTPSERIPVQRYDRPFYARGLDTYFNALNVIRSGQPTMSDTIKTQFYPQMQDMVHWSSPLGERYARRDDLRGLLELPAWLREFYNLPGASIDLQNGRLALPAHTAPAQDGRLNTRHVLRLTPENSWLPTAPESPAGMIEPLVALLDTTHWQTVVAYQPDYVQDGFTRVDSIYEDPYPVQIYDDPGAVMKFLPQTLIKVNNGGVAATKVLFNLIEGLDKLPEMTGKDWLDALLAQALPDTPQLPAYNANTLRSLWFDNDIYGVEEALNQRWPVPDAPYIPVYNLGVNKEWLYP